MIASIVRSIGKRVSNRNFSKYDTADLAQARGSILIDMKRKILRLDSDFLSLITQPSDSATMPSTFLSVLGLVNAYLKHKQESLAREERREILREEHRRQDEKDRQEEEKWQRLRRGQAQNREMRRRMYGR